MYLTIGLTIAAKADSQVEGYSGVAFTTLQFFYVLELLRDIDDPFEVRVFFLHFGAGWRRAPGVLAHSLALTQHARARAHLHTHTPQYDARKLLPIVTEGRVSMPGAGVSAEVDLFPIMNCYARISQRAGRVVGKADRSQDLVVVQGTGEVVRRPHLQQQQQQRQQPAGEEKKQKGGEGGEGEEEEEEKLLEEEEITEQHFVGELRAAMGKAWAEVDGVEDVSGAGDIGSSSSGSGSGSAASRSSVPLEVEEEEEEGEEGEEEEGEEEEGAVSHEEREQQQQQQQQASGEGASLDEALPWHPEARLALAAATRGGAAWSQSWSTDSSALRHRAPRQPQHAAAAAAAAAQPPPSLAVRTAPSALLPGAWPSLAAAPGPASSSPPAASPLSSQSSGEGWREGKRFAAHTSGAYRGGSVVR